MAAALSRAISSRYPAASIRWNASTPKARPSASSGRGRSETMPAKNTICLWYDGGAREAAEFYASVFPDSTVSAVHTAPGDYPSGQAGDELTVDFTVCGIPCLGLNGGPNFPQTEAFSFQIMTEDQ